VLGLSVPKQLQVSAWSAEELSEGQVAYAAADAVLAYQVWPKLKAALQHRPARQTWSLWEAYELQRRAIPAVADMERRGLGFDRAEHARQVEAWSLALATARHQYKEIAGSAPPASQKDKQAWLRQVLDEYPEHLEVWPRTATGLLSTRAGQLRRLIFIDTVQAMLEIQTYEKLLSSFGPRLAQRISPVTGRIHGRYNIAATKSGRFSASNPNLQQLPRRRAIDFPRCVVAAPGYRLISCDWSMVEMRAAAWLYHDRALTRIFAAGRDIHSETAAAISGLPVDEISPEQRDGAKAINYGSIFGQGPQGLRESAFLNYGVEFSLVEAERACARFKKAYPELQQGLWDNYHLCQARGYIVIGAGRAVKAEWETDVGGRLLYTRCCNLPIQGICADALLRAIAWLYSRLKQARVHGGSVGAIHDELLLEIAEDDAEKARKILEDTMLEAFATTFPGAPTSGVATAKIGRTWWGTKQ
jgi:DNA polymerase I-like protein with 3'-5' exonuclease and polymerase domains